MSPESREAVWRCHRLPPAGVPQTWSVALHSHSLCSPCESRRLGHLWEELGTMHGSAPEPCLSHTGSPGPWGPRTGTVCSPLLRRAPSLLRPLLVSSALCALPRSWQGQLPIHLQPQISQVQITRRTLKPPQTSHKIASLYQPACFYL